MGQFKGSLAILIILFLLCWPAGLVYLLIKYEETPSYPAMMCPYCEATVYPNYRACPACGRPLATPPPYGSPPAGSPPPLGSKTCENCGGTVKITDQYCQYCGKKQW